MITVNVKAFGSLTKCFPDLEIGQTQAIELPPGTTLQQLADQLNLPAAKAFFVDGRAQKEDYVLQDQNEVAFMPLVGGG